MSYSTMEEARNASQEIGARMVAPRYIGIVLLGLSAFTGCAGLQDTEYAFSNWTRAECYWLSSGTFSERNQHSSDYAKGWKKGFYDAAMGRACNDPAVPPPCYWSAKYQSCEGRNAIQDWYSGYRTGVAVARSKGYPSFHDVPVGLCAPVINKSSCTSCFSADKCNCPAQPLAPLAEGYGTDATVIPNHATLSKDDSQPSNVNQIAKRLPSGPIPQQSSPNATETVPVQPTLVPQTASAPASSPAPAPIPVAGPQPTKAAEPVVIEQTTPPVLTSLPPVGPVRERISSPSDEGDEQVAVDGENFEDEAPVLRSLPSTGTPQEVAREPQEEEVLVR